MMRILMIAGVACGVAAVAPLLLEDRAGLAPDAATPAATAPATVVSAKPQAPEPLGRAVRLGSDGRGHYSGEFRLNGRRVDSLVDTGASVVAINRSTARLIGLTLTQADFVHEVRTANGTTTAAAAVIERIEIGRIEVRDVRAVVLDDAALAGTLVGMSFLGKLGRFEISDGTLMMEQ